MVHLLFFFLGDVPSLFCGRYNSDVLMMRSVGTSDSIVSDGSTMLFAVF
jgi:hypothetical protein